MNKRFKDVVGALEGKCQALLAMTPLVANELPIDTPVGGVQFLAFHPQGWVSPMNPQSLPREPGGPMLRL